MRRDIAKTAARTSGMVVILCNLLCASCAPEVKDVQAEVDQIATAGKPLKTAISQLTDSGFGCDRASPTACSRSARSCVEQVVIFSDSRGLVIRGRVDGVHCLYVP